MRWGRLTTEIAAWAEDDREAYEEQLRAARLQPDPGRRARAIAAADAWFEDRKRESPLPEFAQPLPSLHRLWAGFWELSEGDRQVFFGAFGGAIYRTISYAAKSQWLRDHGYRPQSEEWMRADHLLRALDREYVAAKQRETNEAAAKKPPDGAA